MHDYAHRRDSNPDNKRLLLELEIIRDQMHDDTVEVRWVNTRQQIADALAKDGAEACFVMFKARAEDRSR